MPGLILAATAAYLIYRKQQAAEDRAVQSDGEAKDDSEVSSTPLQQSDDGGFESEESPKSSGASPLQLQRTPTGPSSDGPHGTTCERTAGASAAAIDRDVDDGKTSDDGPDFTGLIGLIGMDEVMNGLRKPKLVVAGIADYRQDFRNRQVLSAKQAFEALPETMSAKQ